MVRLCFVIRQLNMGGAQRQLLGLLAALPSQEFELHLVRFYPGGEFEEEAQAIPGLRLHCVGKRGRFDLLPAFLRFLRILRSINPDVLHGYLYLGNLASLLAGAHLPRRPKVVWGLRSSHCHLEHYSFGESAMGWLERAFSKCPDLIIGNSYAGRDYGISVGYSPDKWSVIPNGIRTDFFKRNDRARDELRRDWGVPEDAPVVGIVGRLDPKKQHKLFIDAAHFLLRSRPAAKFVVVGTGSPDYQSELVRYAKGTPVHERLLWLGARSDMPALYSALDVVVLCSNAAEGFPNVVAEALSCGTPCVVFDTGDASKVVPSTDFVVAEPTPVALAQKLYELLTRPDLLNSDWLRETVVERFSVDRCMADTRSAILSLFPSKLAA